MTRKYPVDNVPEVLERGQPPLAYARNGVIPSAWASAKAARMLNSLLARGRVLFSKTWPSTVSYDANTTTDATTSLFACHTGPLASKVRVAYVVQEPGGAFATGDSYAYWVTETGLTGAGSSTTRAKVYNARSGSTAVTSTLRVLWQEFSISADTDYRFALHQSNRFNLQTVTVYEIPRTVLLSSESSFVEVAPFYHPGFILDGSIAGLVSGAEKLWKRGGHPIFQWSRDGTAYVTRTTNTAANLLDQTVTTVSANSPGWPVSVPYSGTLSTTTVPCIAWCYALTNAGTGTIEIKNQAGTVLATFSVGSANTWQSTTLNLTDAGGTQTTKLDVHITGPGGGNTLSVAGVGVFMYSS